MKTTKGGKVMNPTDAYRKEIRKKELKRNKKERKKVREVGILKKDPESIKEQIDKLETMKADGALDKARKHKKRQLEDTLKLVMKKRKEYEEKMREKGEAPVMFSHLGPPQRRTAAEEDERAKHPKPEDSVYYHPTLNPTGAPPPGRAPMYKPSIGPRIPLSDSSSTGASSSRSEFEEMDLPAPPPPPPLPSSDPVESVSGDDSILPSSLPLPPPPPVPPKLPTDSSASLPLPPPPPPGPPPKEQAGLHTSLPPPPPLQRLAEPQSPSTGGDRERSENTTLDDQRVKESTRAATVLPPPPPPPGLLPRAVGSESAAMVSEGEAIKSTANMIRLPPPPPRQPPPPPRVPLITMQDVLPPGIARFPPPPPPPDMRPQVFAPGLPPRPLPGIIAQPIPRPPFGPPPGPPQMLMPLIPIGIAPFQEDDPASFRPTVPPKPSYVKSAASTVVKRPLAQHTPELTAMVPASVRVRRETVAPKAKPKTQSLGTVSAPTPPSTLGTAVGKAEASRNASLAPKPQNMDDSYSAFLEDMKALGALES
ncbi:hypothetical protein QJS10_CPB21g00176 [Acorus calamus]|uniref:Wbp11/ELF5/Saf1 N-terminal domain-containing protein n=1 Tax=Acorus calamus TaxID=4465 RepID=A0AAV9C504_ACOCL|nr:hypothetical protein QJS10_CPB21g00176 [Acorus calamus]